MVNLSLESSILPDSLKIVQVAPVHKNKRAHRALGRSPEVKVKGHSGAIYRGPQAPNLNNFGRGPLDDALYQIWKLWAL